MRTRFRATRLPSHSIVKPIELTEQTVLIPTLFKRWAFGESCCCQSRRPDPATEHVSYLAIRVYLRIPVMPVNPNPPSPYGARSYDPHICKSSSCPLNVLPTALS